VSEADAPVYGVRWKATEVAKTAPLHIVAYAAGGYPYRLHPFGRMMVVTQGDAYFTVPGGASPARSLRALFSADEDEALDLPSDFQVVGGIWPRSLVLEGTNRFGHPRESAFRFVGGQLEALGAYDGKDFIPKEGSWQAPRGNEAFLAGRGVEVALLSGALDRELHRSSKACPPTQRTIRNVVAGAYGDLTVRSTGCGRTFIERWKPNVPDGDLVELPPDVPSDVLLAEGGGHVFLAATSDGAGLPYVASLRAQTFERVETHQTGYVRDLAVAADGTAYLTLEPKAESSELAALLAFHEDGVVRRHVAEPGVELDAVWAVDATTAFVAMRSTLRNASAIYSTQTTPLRPGAPLPQALNPFEQTSPSCVTPFVFFANEGEGWTAEELRSKLREKHLDTPDPANQPPEITTERLVSVEVDHVRRLGLAVPSVAVGRRWVGALGRPNLDADPVLVCFAPPPSATLHALASSAP
jgi:hypothetical protein